jgi:hypothetical protein
MKNTHIIQRQVFKIEIDSQNKFKELCQVIEDLFKYELGEHIEKILDQYNINNQDILIERLDIDLGRIDPSNLQQSIKSAFISAFQYTLEEKIKRSPAQVRIIDRETRNKTVFDFFIKNGNTPWWISTKTGNLKKEFTKFFYSRTYQTKSIWQKALKNPLQYKRLLFNLDLELLISHWVSTKSSRSNIPKQSMIKALMAIVERQGQIVGKNEVARQVKSAIISEIFSSKKSANRFRGTTESIKNLFGETYIDNYTLDKIIRDLTKPSLQKPNLLKDTDKPKASIEFFDGNIEQSITDEFIQFLQNGYPVKRNRNGGFNSITEIFDYLVSTNIDELSILLRFHARNTKIRKRFLDQVSQESISAFFTAIAPDKKELFQWIKELYLPAEEVLKPINQTNIRVQKSVNEVTLEIFIQQNLNNLSNEAFMSLHFKKMALRYNIRLSELLRVVVNFVSNRKNKKSNESKFITILENLYVKTPGSKNQIDQELEDDEDWELVINQEKKEIPEQLLNKIPRDVIKELMHVKNSGILGKSSISIQHLISSYIRYSNKSRKSKIDDPKELIKIIADFLEVDKSFLEFGLIFSARLQKESNLFVSQEHLLFDQLSNSPVATTLSTKDELGLLIKHFIKYKTSFELSHLKKVFNKKVIFEKIDKKTFRQFIELIFEDQHKKITDFILGIALVEDIDARKKIEKLVYATFVHETLSAGTGNFNIAKIFSKIKILLKGYIKDSIEIPSSILGIASAYNEKTKKRKSRKKSTKVAYIKEKNLLTLYHILDLDLVLENVGSNFFDNIIFSFDLLLTKHRDEFTEVLYQNRFNKELAYFLTYQDEAGLLQQIEKIFSVSKVERIHKALESAIKLLGKLNWLKMSKDEVVKYITLFSYPPLFSKVNEPIGLHDFIYNIIETAEKEKLLSNDFYMLFEQQSEKEALKKISEILDKDLIPKELIGDVDNTTSMLRIEEFTELAKKNTDDPGNLYHFELLLGVLENLRFPEGHAFYGQSWVENKEYINRILKKSPIALKKLQEKKLVESQREMFYDVLDIENLRLSISNIYAISPLELDSIFTYWLKKTKFIAGYDEKTFFKKILLKSKHGQHKVKYLNQHISSILLEEKILSAWELLELIYEPRSEFKVNQENISAQDLLKNITVDADTWTNSYFKILTSKEFGNPKAYKEINAWIRFMFSPLMHKTQKQTFLFIFTIYFKFSFWKLKDPLLMHGYFIDELGILKNKDASSLAVLLKYMISAGIPMKAILAAASQQLTTDNVAISDLLSKLTENKESNLSSPEIKFTSSSILTPEQFSNTLLFEGSRNAKAAQLFQHWIGTKKWIDSELKTLFKVIPLPVLLRELYLMSKFVDLKKIIDTWLIILERQSLFSDKSKRYQAILSIVLKDALWKYRSEELIHAIIIKSLALLNNKSRSEILSYLELFKELNIPIGNFPKLKDLGLASDRQEIKFILEQFNFSQSDPRLSESSDETNLPDKHIESDITFFMQSGGLSFYDEPMSEGEKLIAASIHDRGLTAFLNFDEVHPDSMDKLLIFFSKNETKEFMLSGIKELVSDQKLLLFFDEVFNDFFEQSDNNSIIKVIQQFNEISKMRTLSAESRLDLLLREISKVRQMEKSIEKSIQIHKKDDLKKVKHLKGMIKESTEKEESIVTDVEKIFIYFLEYGFLMPTAYISSLQELRSILLSHMKEHPNAVRYLLHIKSNVQKSRKRIVQLMRTGMSEEILAIIHPALKKELNAFEMLMRNNFNINIWDVLGIDNDSAKWDYLLLLWSTTNSKVKDPIEIIELLMKSVLKKLDPEFTLAIQKFDNKRFSVSERSIWKALVALIPELKSVPAEQKRKLKSPDEIKNTVEQAEREEEILDPEEGITVYNAGLVLLWPFLSRFFSMLELCNTKDFFGDEERMRAIQLTQYLVNGKTEMEEWNLSLNKIICGADLNFPVQPTLDITIEEEGLSEKMLKGALQNWPKLKNTKPATFQETFLQREGRLYKRDNRWELIVEKKAYDMLLNTLPWNISMIKLNWMSDRLVVVWN